MQYTDPYQNSQPMGKDNINSITEVKDLSHKSKENK